MSNLDAIQSTHNDKKSLGNNQQHWRELAQYERASGSQSVGHGRGAQRTKLMRGFF